MHSPWARAAALIALLLTAAPALAFARTPHLIDQTGRSFTLAALRGEPLIVTFVAAHCTDACPLVNAQMGEAVRQARAQRWPVHFLTITLDPEHDSAADMRKIATEFQADPRTWIVASGASSDVHAVMRDFDVLAQRGKNGFADVHTTFVYLLDTHGRVRSALLASNHLDQQILNAVRTDWSTLSQ